MRTRKIRWLLYFLLGGLVIHALMAAERKKEGMEETAIRQVLERQVEDWNRKNLEGYMTGYWKSPDLTFFSGGAVARGWEATLERYRKRYQGEGQEMGKLDFSDLVIERLDAKSAYVRGRWHLVMSSGKEPKGLFTLIVKKFPDGWKIVHDHTSVE